MASIAFLLGFSATGLLRWLGRIGAPLFYSQALVAIFVTLVAAGAAWCSNYLGLSVNATLLVISGIVLLVAGLMFVGAFQDAIDEYYMTANARLLKVVMATGGVIAGVMVGLYIATKFGITFPATPDRLTLADGHTQYLGAGIIAAAFVLRNHSRFFGMII